MDRPEEEKQEVTARRSPIEHSMRPMNDETKIRTGGLLMAIRYGSAIRVFRQTRYVI